jgi:hypothetical protein
VTAVKKQINNLSYIAAISYIYGALTIASLRTKLIENNPEEIVKEISQMTADTISPDSICNELVFIHLPLLPVLLPVLQMEVAELF